MLKICIGLRTMAGQDTCDTHLCLGSASHIPEAIYHFLYLLGFAGMHRMKFEQVWQT